MDEIDVESTLTLLLNRLADRLSDADVQNIQDYLTHNEWGLSFEILCNILRRVGCHLSLEEYQLLTGMGKQMQIDSAYWLPLKEAVTASVQTGNDDRE